MSYGLVGCNGRVYGLGRYGLGDCTPTNCPGGPYDNPEFNYAYFLNQTTTPDQEAPGPQNQPISSAAIQAFENQSQPLMSYNDLIASAGGFKTCSPRDESCVLYNEELQAAVENYWTANKERVPVGTVFNFTPDLSQAALNQFGVPGYTGPGPQNVVAPGSFQITSGGTSNPMPPGPPPAQPAAGAGSGAPAKPANPIPSSWLQNIFPATSAAATVSDSSAGGGGFSIPTWGWLALAVGVGALALGGKN